MADVNLPQINQLGSMFQMNPLAFQQAQNQIDLGNQFAQQNLAQGEQDLQAKTLANMFQVQNDPLKLKKSELDIEGTTAENVIKKIEAEQRSALAPQELELKRAKMVKEWSDTKLEKAMNDAQEMMWSDDPKLQEKGKSLYANSFKELSARWKAKDELTKQESENASRERVAAGNNAATLGAARISADARERVADSRNQGAKDFDEILARYGKTYEARQGLYEQKARSLEQAGDMEGANYYRQVADRERIQNERKLTAGTDARLAAQPSLPGMTNGKIQERGSSLPAVPPQPSRSISGPVSNLPAPEPGVSGAFDLGPNNERLNMTIRAIRGIKDPQERANAAAALERQLSGAHGAPAPQPAAPAANGLPKAGEVRKGYRFKGGDPSKKENWEKV